MGILKLEDFDVSGSRKFTFDGTYACLIITTGNSLSANGAYIAQGYYVGSTRNFVTALKTATIISFSFGDDYTGFTINVEGGNTIHVAVLRLF